MAEMRYCDVCGKPYPVSKGVRIIIVRQAQNVALPGQTQREADMCGECSPFDAELNVKPSLPLERVMDTLEIEISKEEEDVKKGKAVNMPDPDPIRGRLREMCGQCNFDCSVCVLEEYDKLKRHQS